MPIELELLVVICGVATLFYGRNVDSGRVKQDTHSVSVAVFSVLRIF